MIIHGRCDQDDNKEVRNSGRVSTRICLWTMLEAFKDLLRIAFKDETGTPIMQDA